MAIHRYADEELIPDNRMYDDAGWHRQGEERGRRGGRAVAVHRRSGPLESVAHLAEGNDRRGFPDDRSDTPLLRVVGWHGRRLPTSRTARSHSRVGPADQPDRVERARRAVRLAAIRLLFDPFGDSDAGCAFGLPSSCSFSGKAGVIRRARVMSFGLLVVSFTDSLLRNHVCDFTKLKFSVDRYESPLSRRRTFAYGPTHSGPFSSPGIRQCGSCGFLSSL